MKGAAEADGLNSVIICLVKEEKRIGVSKLSSGRHAQTVA